MSAGDLTLAVVLLATLLGSAALLVSLLRAATRPHHPTTKPLPRLDPDQHEENQS